MMKNGPNMRHQPPTQAPRLVLRRGQIVLAELDPVVGAEQGKTRPVVVLSNDAANEVANLTRRSVVTVATLTSRVRPVEQRRPYQAVITAEESGLAVDSTVQGEQLRAISATRIVRSLGFLNAEAMARVDEAVRWQLAL
jgi:mRNA interferase MazF